jgi:cysteine desulfurase family protein (TIGR01976 family)
MSLDLAVVRAQFPALAHPRIYLDNPGGTQVASSALERIQGYLVNTNANHGGEFATSRDSDALVEAARSAMADLLNAGSPEEIVFGPNMTTLTFNVSRALAQTFQPGDLLVVTRMDHDGNISPWLRVAEDRGCRVRWVDFDPHTGRLDQEDYKAALAEGPRLVAFGYASNALGTINPAAEMTALARQAGALVYVDAVQYAPHGPIDVRKLGCDFLVCSAYKFFGPHAGVLYGRYDLLDRLHAYRVRPAPATPPGKFEMGTGNFEAIAGVLGAVEYFTWLGEQFGAAQDGSLSGDYSGRRRTLKQALLAVRAYEYELSNDLLTILDETPGVTIHGPQDLARLDERTVSFTVEGRKPAEIARALDGYGINVWNGNYYALAVTERLGLEASGGMVRVGPVHYNTREEIARFGEALHEILVSG